MTDTNKQSISTQLQIEKELLAHIVASLRTALDWTPEDVGSTRQLSTLRFVAQAFHRHLERLMAIHEHDGYMSYITQNAPHMQPEVDKLKKAHDEFQDELQRISSHLDLLAPADSAAFKGTRKSLKSMMLQYEQHAEKENALLHEAFMRDEGGEG